jgi:hypothetical protein
MGLTMAERKAVTKTIATRYKRSDKVGKARILDELCRDHWVASRPCPQGAARGAAAAGGAAAGAAATEVRVESRCGAGLLLGDIGYADGQAVGANAA